MTQADTGAMAWGVMGHDLHEVVHRGRKWWTVAGVVLTVLGVLAIFMPVVMGATAMLLLGVVLIVSGVSQVLHAFASRGWGGFAVQLLLGVLYAAVGVLLATQPLAGLVAMTLIVAIFLFVDGAVRLALAFRIKGAPGWGFLAAGGLLSLLLGLIIYLGWPGDSIWVIGMFIGIDMLIWGVTLLGLSSALARRGRERGAPRMVAWGRLRNR